MGDIERSPSDARPLPVAASSEGEEHVVRRAQMGSGAAFEQLVVARGPELYRYLAMRLRNESDARDALQETLTAAWESLPRLREPRRFWPWLVAIAAHKAADAARRRTVSAEPFDAVKESNGEVVEIREALDSLAPRFREVLLLRYGLELSEHEVAAVLGVRIGTVKSRSARARKALGELLA